ncbi:DNAJ heat shock N-terminal domain-containing protein [Dictyostelium discoideum AX4]|uniref:DnaJ homolog subfamily C member 3 homolog n=1 Tax=Dictyostelium discoideum TaxID=44689 RepID=DNJC3_DICDI|nr:DNAJ heat shock N-terminal domain-containing protein [Dictyostelium discoideum AX4]Q54M21.1 RecName: Full=DnaJ homolog subfamily C member 3 homolog; Flags: Precursor [Dictyostelium discoideum]EAL64301.1 DNAJ heat shock N-terminal domain-containing protein [Dictyostelium discoideum AX4]|eukprot:XP_637810.1 DNAJ heat shock N-terminal domain-containing protein [Dictyostelium discoideum AX4]
MIVNKKYFLLICIIILISINCLVLAKDEIENFLKEGDDLVSKGKYDLANENYSNAIDLIGSDTQHPQYVSLLFKRAGIYHQKGKNILALSDLNRAIEANPDNIHARLKRAKIQSSLGRFEEAMDEYKRVLKIRPDNSQAKQQIEKLKKVEQQLEKVRDMVKVEKNYKDSIAILLDIQSVVSDLKEVRLMLCECFFQQGDHRKVLDETMTILKSEPSSVAALYWRGKTFFSMGEKEIAMKFLKEGLKFDPDNTNCRAMIKTINKFEKSTANAQELFNQQKYQDALGQIEDALEIEPNSPTHSTPLYLLKCKCLLKVKKGKESIEACNRALELDELNADALYNRAEAYMYEEDYQKALNDYNKAREHKPNDPQIHDGIRRAQKAQQMAKRKDYYKILGIQKSATPEEIKKAFKKLAIKNHPDKSTETDKEKAQQIYMDINEAYEALKDEEKRKRYDMGEDINDPHGGQGGQGGGFGGFGGFHGFQGFQGFQQGGGGGGFQFHFR